ncbi:MAG TPA: ABC transporter permease, partial [Gaiellaceae bacterium]|nr:ABC transporter permease [Gaiellaceae bacterium]
MTQTKLETPADARAAVRPAFGPTERSDRIVVIRPAPRWPHLDLRELWHFRELLFRLVWRDIVVRYKQTSIGVTWAILQPFVTMVVFTLVFGKFADFPSKNVPYPIFTYSALLPWTYFASAVALSAGSIVSNKALVTKIYFPRVLAPLAGVTVPAVDFALAFTVLIGMMAWFDVWPSAALVLAPAFLLMGFVAALGVGLFLSAVNVRYR